jgi:hypothetical protein
MSPALAACVAGRTFTVRGSLAVVDMPDGLGPAAAVDDGAQVFVLDGRAVVTEGATGRVVYDGRGIVYEPEGGRAGGAAVVAATDLVTGDGLVRRAQHPTEPVPAALFGGEILANAPPEG